MLLYKGRKNNNTTKTRVAVFKTIFLQNYISIMVVVRANPAEIRFIGIAKMADFSSIFTDVILLCTNEKWTTLVHPYLGFSDMGVRSTVLFVDSLRCDEKYYFPALFIGGVWLNFDIVRSDDLMFDCCSIETNACYKRSNTQWAHGKNEITSETHDPVANTLGDHIHSWCHGTVI